ncbi:MFS transporter [Streptomyces sp. NPDC088258]|uniref:MFS transporter n=1 Tax=Streptomyces sp. NPDC088258 TaxID=3365849 RepID=UPI0038223D53
MTGAAPGTALGAVVWILAQRLSDDALMTWGRRLVFGSGLVVTVAAMVIRRKLNESPVFQELKEKRERPASPVKDVLAQGRRPMLLVLFMNWGISTQSCTYQVFMASYPVTTVGVDKKFVPEVLLLGAVCGGIAAVGFGTLSDRFGRKPVCTTILGALVLLPVPTFVALNSGSKVAPETRDRDLNLPYDATDPGAARARQEGTVTGGRLEKVGD